MVSMPLTARIIYLRESRGLNRTRLAQLSGVSLRTLEDWEAGRRVPRDVYQIHAVAAALDMSIEDYLGLKKIRRSGDVPGLPFCYSGIKP